MKVIRNVLWVWLLCLVMGCGMAEAESMEKLLAEIRKKHPDVSQLSTEKLAAWLEDTSREAPLLIDARTQKEYRVSHLPGARRAEPGRCSLRTRSKRRVPCVRWRKPTASR